jgi:hypothetical protein
VENAARVRSNCGPICHMMNVEVCISINFYSHQKGGMRKKENRIYNKIHNSPVSVLVLVSVSVSFKWYHEKVIWIQFYVSLLYAVTAFEISNSKLLPLYPNLSSSHNNKL